jgi:hypothetical protein
MSRVLTLGTAELPQEIFDGALLACVHDSARPLILLKDIRRVGETFLSLVFRPVWPSYISAICGCILMFK